MQYVFRIILIFLAGMFLSSCGSSRSKTYTKASKEEIREEQRARSYEPAKAAEARPGTASRIVEKALEFEGTRYKYGGTDEKGMDCSGLIYVSFLDQGISMPRTSRDMSLLGNRLFLKQVAAGDLLFFETSKNRKVINHVGLVVRVTPHEIFFIHSSSSRGVIISSLSEPYWSENFVMAKRVI